MKSFGELRRRIVIVISRNTFDDEGNRNRSDEEVFSCWASVRDAGMKEFYEAAAQQLDDVVNFTIRWRRGIEPGMVVLYDGRRHEIKQVNNLGHKRDFMLLKTNRRAAVG